MNRLLSALAELSRSQLVLRVLIFLGPVVALLAAGPAGRWPTWWVVTGIVVLAAAFAALPETAVGAGVMLAVLAWWAGALDDGLHPAVLVAATGLLVAHLAATLTGYGPDSMPVDPALVRLWVRRGLLLLLSVPLLWLAARGLDGQPEQPGIWVVGVAAGLAATVAAAVALTAGGTDEEAS